MSPGKREGLGSLSAPTTIAHSDLPTRNFAFGRPSASCGAEAGDSTRSTGSSVLTRPCVPAPGGIGASAAGDYQLCADSLDVGVQLETRDAPASPKNASMQMTLEQTAELDEEESSEPAGIRRLLARESGRIGFPAPTVSCSRGGP
jgi:hypothetical protein